MVREQSIAELANLLPAVFNNGNETSKSCRHEKPINLLSLRTRFKHALGQNKSYTFNVYAGKQCVVLPAECCKYELLSS